MRESCRRLEKTTEITDDDKCARGPRLKTPLQLREFADRTEDPSEKEKWLQEVKKLEKEITATEAAGVTAKEPKTKPALGVSS